MIRRVYNDCDKCAMRLVASTTDWLQAWQFDGKITIEREQAEEGWTVILELTEPNAYWDEDIEADFSKLCDLCESEK